jgi:hypothetical protein
MKRRCLDKKHLHYAKYGGRGITVCVEWLDFRGFFSDMGDRPEGYTIERVDSNGGYEKSNCKWATRTEQNNNRSNNKRIAFSGKSLTISQWSEETGLSKATIEGRLRMGWSVEDSLNVPQKDKIRKSLSYKGETRNISQWAKEFGIKSYTIRNRLKLGWSIDKALETPVRGKNGK